MLEVSDGVETCAFPFSCVICNEGWAFHPIKTEEILEDVIFFREKFSEYVNRSIQKWKQSG
jgi:hypothetical protein